MGRILKVEKLTTGIEAVIIFLGLCIVLGGIYLVSPGLRVAASKKLESLNLSTDKIDNVKKGDKLPLPSQTISSKVDWDKPVRISGYAWYGNAALIEATGGPKTTSGSLLENEGVAFEFVRQDACGDIRNNQLKFIEEFDKGVEFPKSDKAAFAISIMGDGGPFYIATTQKAIDEKFGKGKYHVQVIASIGGSVGEDKLIGPAAWKTNPQLMKGALISSVLGDGDWVTAVNFCSANGLIINPDATTYDAEAVNFYPSENDDYINSSKELIKSQQTGFKVTLKVVSNGKLTGKTIDKQIDGCTTWTPGDKLVFDALSGFTDVTSTKDFPNQMSTTIIAVKEWAVGHEKIVTSILESAYTAANQMKQYEEWRVAASESVARAFQLNDGKYWLAMSDGEKGSKGGVDYNMGGSKVMTYADAIQYYGITDGTNRYKSVYDQVSKYLIELNPFGFNENVGLVVPYEDAVNLYFLKSINDVDAGTVTKIDYTATKTVTIAQGNWQINFDNGSSVIQSTSNNNKTLESIYNLLIQAETTKLNVVGHTNTVGNPLSNKTLSTSRANSVVEYLTSRGIPQSRFQVVDGLGDTKTLPGLPGTAPENRRVEITLLN